MFFNQQSIRTLCATAALTMGIGAQAQTAVTIPTADGSYIDWNAATLTNANVENDGANIGSTHQGSQAKFTVTNTTQQDYILEFLTGAKNLTADLAVTLSNGNNKQLDVVATVSNTGNWTPTEQHTYYIPNLPAGSYDLTFTVNSTTASYAGNYGNLAFRTTASYDKIPGTIDLNKGSYNGPRTENNGNVGYVKQGGTATYTFINQEESPYKLALEISKYNAGVMNITITDVATGVTEFVKDYVIADDAPSSYTLNEILVGQLTKGLKTMTFTFTEGSGYIINYQNLSLEKTTEVPDAEALALSSITIGQEAERDLIGQLNADGHKATLSGKIFTAMPKVSGKMNDGSALLVSSELNGTTATYTLKSGQLLYTLVVEGINIYTPAEGEKTVELKYTGAGKQGDGTWSDGIYTLSTTGLDGWEASAFKLNGEDYTLAIPADVRVKQIAFKDFKSNYSPGEDAKLVSIAAEGVTFTVPTYTSYSNTEESKYDLVIPVSGHTAGQTISFLLQGGGQPTAWIELTIEQVAVQTAPVVLGKTHSDATHQNHCTVTISFDREMKAATATVAGQQVKAEGGSTQLVFPVWNLNYGSTNTFTLPAGAAEDIYGNKTTEDITVEIAVGQPRTITAVYDYVVGSAEEFSAAIAAVNTANNNASAERKTIFIKNGDYDFGATEQRITGYNVSLIGESRDGVILHGNRTGISNPVLNLRDRTGFYLQDITVKNDLNYGAENKGGVGVAIYGGNKTAMKNVRMLSNQDTQVTGDRAYFEDCEIHGTVDFICGGGDNYYYNTDLVLENRGGNVIAAPSTSTQTKWGYVFQECTVKAMDGATMVTNGSWNLGRPWQNEPRATYLNTTMEVLPSNNGWTNMSDLPTHFYEYGSMKADGTLIDLSVRGNSPSSTNKYTPVLSAEEAALYTLENVLGGDDSWLPTELTQQTAAPQLSVEGQTISWSAVEGARAYVILLNGKYLTNQTETSFEMTEAGEYTVRAANQAGGLGQASEAVSNALTVTIHSSGWSTFSTAEHAIDFSQTEGLTAYVVTSYDSTVKLEQTDLVPAGVGVVLKGEGGKTYELTTVDQASQPSINLLQTAACTATGKEYALATIGGVTGFYPVKAGVEIPAGKAYLVIEGQAKEFIAIDGETTGIRNINAANDNAIRYNLNGQRVDRTYRGVVIVDGKKIRQ